MMEPCIVERLDLVPGLLSDDDLRRDGVDFALDRRDLLERISLGPDVEDHRIGVVLLERHVDAELRGLAPRGVIRGAGDADNLAELRFAGKLDPAAQGSLGPERAGHGLVDDGDRSGGIAVDIGEVPAGANFNTGGSRNTRARRY